MHSEGVSERIPAPNHHSFQDVRPNTYYTGQLPHPPVAHSFYGKHVPPVSAQQFISGHAYVSDTNNHAHTIPEPTVDPTEGESMSESGMINAPYRPHPVAYSFDGNPSFGYGNRMEHYYGYGNLYGNSIDQVSNYGHQPVEQHYNNSFGGQEHQGNAGLVEYRNSSHRRSTQ